jgi:hypothetical protein
MIDTIIRWSPGMTLDQAEKMVIQIAFQFFKRNKTVTAQSLGIAIRTLDNKLERYEYEEGIERERVIDASRRRIEFLDRQRGNPPNNLGIPYSPTAQNTQTAPLYDSSSGIRMESIANSAGESKVSMSERSEVQKVLQEKTPTSGEKGNRRTLPKTNDHA